MIILLSVLIQIIIFFLFAGNVFDLRKENKIKIIILNIAIIGIISCLLLFSLAKLNPIIFFISSSLILMKYYEGEWKYKILYVVYFVIITIMSEFVIVNLIKLLIHSFSIQEHDFNFAVGALFVNVLQFMFMEIFKKFVLLKNELISSKYFLLSLILPLITFIFILSIPNYLIITTSKNGILLFVIVIGLLFANLMTFYMFAQQLKTISLKMEVEELKNKKALETIYYTYLTKRYHQNFDILHKIKEKMFCIIHDIDNNNYTNVIKTSHEVYKDVSQMMTLSTIGPKSLNIIVDDKISTISKNDINLKVVFEYDDFSFMTVKDQYSLFSLLLDGAINAVLNAKNDLRFISLRSRKVHETIQLTLNYTGNELPTIDEIEHIIANYHGVLIHEEDSKNFYLIIITFEINGGNNVE